MCTNRFRFQKDEEDTDCVTDNGVTLGNQVVIEGANLRIQHYSVAPPVSDDPSFQRTNCAFGQETVVVVGE